LCSSLVSSITTDDILLATSDMDNEGGTGNDRDNDSGEQSGGDEVQDDDQKEQQKEGDIEKPMDGAIPMELPQRGAQGATCLVGEVINSETGKCEKTELEEIGNEICDNTKDDDFDKQVDESDCESLDDQSDTDTQTGIPSNAPTSMLPLDPSLTSSSPLPGLGTEGKSEASETIRREGMMPSSSPTPPSPPTSAGPGDLIAPPSPDDPDFCLKESARQQITGEPTSPRCMPGQKGGSTPTSSGLQGLLPVSPLGQAVPSSSDSDQPPIPTDGGMGTTEGGEQARDGDNGQSGSGTTKGPSVSNTIDVPGDTKITYTHHPNGKIASQTFAWPDGTMWSNTFSPDGKKATETRTDSNGRKTTYTNEPYTITTEVPGVSKITTVYGPSGTSETIAFYGGNGHTIYNSDNTGAITHTTQYDRDGHWSILFPKQPDGTIKTYFENGTNVIHDDLTGKELKRWNEK
jgi:hypothetical protein